MPKINGRRKGAVGERELSQVMKRHGFDGARRGQQRSGLDQSDVVDGPDGWHFECKRVEALNVWKAWAQAVRDAQGRTPAIAMRRNHGEWLAVVRLDWLLAELRRQALAELCGEGHDSDP